MIKYFRPFFLLSIAAISCSAALFSQINNDLIVVSCSGKSGSSTLEGAFADLGFETYRCHNIQDEMFQYILEKEKTGNVLLIDSMRDIISRKISSFFQNLVMHTNLSKDVILSKYQKTPRACLQMLQRIFNENIFKIATSNSFKQWSMFNYNCITDGVFDFRNKYQLKKIGNLYFVNLRFDDIKKWEEILKSIDLPMDLSNIIIPKINRAQNKWYKDIYRDFLYYFSISQADFDTILSTYAEELAHFYTAKEIKAFIAKWQPHIR